MTIGTMDGKTTSATDPPVIAVVQQVKFFSFYTVLAFSFF